MTQRLEQRDPDDLAAFLASAWLAGLDVADVTIEAWHSYGFTLDVDAVADFYRAMEREADEIEEWKA
jgi:hypothetical protein